MCLLALSPQHETCPDPRCISNYCLPPHPLVLWEESMLPPFPDTLQHPPKFSFPHHSTKITLTKAFNYLIITKPSGYLFHFIFTPPLALDSVDLRATILVGHNPHRLGSGLLTPEVVQSELWLNFHPSWKFLCLGLLWYCPSLVFPHLFDFPFTVSLQNPLPPPTLKNLVWPLWLSSLSLSTMTLELVFHQWPQPPLVLAHWSLLSLYLQCWPLSGIQNHYSQLSHLLTLISTDANFPHFVTTKCWDSLHINYKYEASELSVRDNRWSVNWSVSPMDNSEYHIKNELSIRRLFN